MLTMKLSIIFLDLAHFEKKNLLSRGDELKKETWRIEAIKKKQAALLLIGFSCLGEAFSWN